ncbi:MAG: DUF4012 domain-containing protein [Chloroflexi bacterium]|nr:DUF4012 domain-containing protein [Chloroflexota bacterium]
MSALVEQRPALESASAAAHRAEAAWSQVNTDALSPSMQARVSRIPQTLPLLTEGLDLALALPDLLGAGGPREYLLLAQNSDELRPTGGFISAAGTIRLDGGRLGDFSLRDSYAIDDLAAHPYPEPPRPLTVYMGSQLWLFRDANWSPDFPTSARAALDLYELGQDVRPGGVIAFDQQAVQRILAALGWVAVPDTPDMVTADNVVEYMRRAWSAEPGEGVSEEWWLQRKDFMGNLANAMLDKLQTGPLDLSALLGAVLRAFDERHILVYVEEPTVAELLARRGWDGAVRPGAGDFLMLADSNVGFNKVNPNVAVSATYEVNLGDAPAPTAVLRLTYRHLLGSGAPCVQEANLGEGKYEELMARCYWDYVRVLAPADSQLTDSLAPKIPTPWTLTAVGFDGTFQQSVAEAGTTEFSGLLVLPPGETRTIELHYRLPAEALIPQGAGRETTYRLRVAKEPGTRGTPLEVRVILPEGSELVSSAPASEGTGKVLVFQFDLTTDETLEIIYRTP